MSTNDHEGTPLLDVKGVSKRFGGIQAVAEGNLRVAAGEMVGLVGPNGCGKSTMLAIVTGLVKPDRGSVTFGGQPLPLGQYRQIQQRGVRFVPQELSLALADSVWESITLGAEPASRGVISRRTARNQAAQALAQLGHELPVDAAVGSLSPVDRRLVMIARGVAHHDSRLLILDEPTAGLPHEEATRVVEAMRNLVDQDRSLILVSHHIGELASVCDHVTLMQDGKTYRTLTGSEVNKETIVGLLLSGVPDAGAAKLEGPAIRSDGEDVATLAGVRAEYLNGVSLSARRGEVVGIAGILGSGATEVVQLLTGQRQPQAGDVRVGAAGIKPSSPHKALQSGVGFVSGDRSTLVIKGMTVSEHVALPALFKLRRGPLLSRRRERRWVDGGLSKLNVKGEPSAPMTSLSGGNQQRALMARWAALVVDLLVVDQPTVGVDIAGRAQLLSVLRSLAQDRGVVLYAEPEELSAICDRVVCLRRGAIAAELAGSGLTSAAILDAIT